MYYAYFQDGKRISKKKADELLGGDRWGRILDIRIRLVKYSREKYAQDSWCYWNDGFAIKEYSKASELEKGFRPYQKRA